jgi:hypothetical protein
MKSICLMTSKNHRRCSLKSVPQEDPILQLTVSCLNTIPISIDMLLQICEIMTEIWYEISSLLSPEDYNNLAEK